MSQKIKMLCGVGVFAVIILGALVVYNRLSEQVESQNEVEIAEGSASLAEESEAKTEASDFVMKDMDGNEVWLSDLISEGKPIVVNFWASWCPPCKQEMPGFDKLYGELGDEVQFVMVDLTDGQRETIQAGTQYVQDAGYTFPVYFDTTQQGALTYYIRSIPTTLFIDKEGYVVSRLEGAIDEETLGEEIEKLK